MVLKFQKIVLPIALLTTAGASTANGLKLNSAMPIIVEVDPIVINYESEQPGAIVVDAKVETASAAQPQPQRETEDLELVSILSKAPVSEVAPRTAVITTTPNPDPPLNTNTNAAYTTSSAQSNHGPGGKRQANRVPLKDMAIGLGVFVACVAAGLALASIPMALNAAFSEEGIAANGTPTTQGGTV